jgi:hypothetical protein
MTANDVQTSLLRNGNESHIIDPNSPASMKLLNKAYDTVYKSSFPMADERETKADLQQYTKDGDTIVTLIGEKLDSAKPVIKGISVMYPYPDEDKKQYIGLLGYLAVGEKYRKEGLGHTLFDVSRMDIADRAKAEGLKLAAMVHECNPVGTKNDNMDPAKRMAMYERWGCIKVPFPYSQQPLTADGESVPLVLMAEPDPKTGKYPSKQASIRQSRLSRIICTPWLMKLHPTPGKDLPIKTNFIWIW